MTTKSDFMRPWVYCAGKISPNDWRNDIFYTRRHQYAKRGWEIDDDRSTRFIGCGDGGNHPEFRYAGPFFIGCDHGCYHGAESHGCGIEWSGHGLCNDVNGAPSRQDVIGAGLSCINATDLMFVWIDKNFPTAYGTMAEIGYAIASGKPVYAAMSQDAPSVREQWFPLLMTQCLGVHADPKRPLHLAWLAYLGRVVSKSYSWFSVMEEPARRRLTRKGASRPGFVSAA